MANVYNELKWIKVIKISDIMIAFPETQTLTLREALVAGNNLYLSFIYSPKELRTLRHFLIMLGLGFMRSIQWDKSIIGDDTPGYFSKLLVEYLDKYADAFNSTCSDEKSVFKLLFEVEEFNSSFFFVYEVQIENFIKENCLVNQEMTIYEPFFEEKNTSRFDQISEHMEFFYHCQRGYVSRLSASKNLTNETLDTIANNFCIIARQQGVFNTFKVEGEHCLEVMTQKLPCKFDKMVEELREQQIIKIYEIINAGIRINAWNTTAVTRKAIEFFISQACHALTALNIFYEWQEQYDIDLEEFREDLKKEQKYEVPPIRQHMKPVT